MTVHSSLCDFCLHRGKGSACKAYPDGIPRSILTGAVDHFRPRNGDGGTLYQLDPLFRDIAEDGVRDGTFPAEAVTAAKA
jgi:hypothetical protein